jgi:proton glutamate symport protein
MKRGAAGLLEAYSRRLPWFIMTSVLAAATTGIVLGLSTGTCPAAIAFVGDLFLQCLKMIVVPLIVTSIISATANIGARGGFGRLGLKTALWYVCTSLLAILTGLALVNIIRPGVGADMTLRQEVEAFDTQVESVGDFVMRLIPTNPVESMARGDILPLIFFSLLFGIFIARVGGKHRESLQDFFQAAFEVMMKITRFILLLAPVGIFGLVAKPLAETGEGAFDVLLHSLLPYFLTVLGGLWIHAFITLPLLFFLFTRKNPYRLARAFSPALLTAFSTASSSATLPLTMERARDEAGVSEEISGFVLPLGATVNMDGTALYECVAAMFIAQVYGIHPGFFEQVIIVYTALLASIGAAGIPMAGLVMLTIVLKAVGLPLEGIGLIMVVDRILDMFRTSVNVWSDSTGTSVIAFSEGEKDILSATRPTQTGKG